MITHVCPTCRRRHELSDDYEGIIFVCTVCQETAEVRVIKNHITIPVEDEKPGHVHESWKESPPIPTHTEVPWQCPRCTHFGHAVIRSGGLNEGGIFLASFPFGAVFICCFGFSVIGPELAVVLIFLAAMSASWLFILLVVDRGRLINRYSAHCEKCGYWFR